VTSAARGVRARPRLFDELPELATLPFLPLAHVPTPVERATALAPYLGRDDVWMKRDDLASPIYGGNKVRRYELVLADARAKGARSIVTAGGLASTQVTATALFGRELGLPVHVVLFDQPVTRFAREALLADAEAGAHLIHGGGYAWTAYLVARELRRHEGSYLILPGAPDPLSNLGYVDAMLELADQVERGELPRPDVIVLPTGSSGTLAALAIGASWLGWPTEIVGVRITAAIACNRLTVGAIIAATERFLTRRSPTFARRRRARPLYRLLGDAIGPGYGEPTPAAIDGAAWVERLIGAPGEVTYSGKALVGLRTVARDPRYAGKTIVLWNTLSRVRPPAPASARAKLPRDLDFVFEGEVPV
jgi:D-cysteine desulfhydrase